MNKNLLTMFIVMVSSSLFAGQVVSKIILDSQISATSKSGVLSNVYDTDLAMSLGFEYLQSLNENINIGGGIEYQFNRKSTNLDNSSGLFASATFRYMPIYVTSEYLIPVHNGKMKLFAKVNLGYAIEYIGGAWNEGYSAKGGLYWAIGGGAMMTENIKLELMYAICKGSATGYGEKWRDTYAKISLGIGYIF